MPPKDALPFVQTVWKSFINAKGLETSLFGMLNHTHAIPGQVVSEMTIEPHHLNKIGTLHGGTIAALADIGGSLAVASRGLYTTGVSTDITVQYISSGGHLGDKITLESECHKLGKSMAFTSVIFKNAQSQIFAKASHTKYCRHGHVDDRKDKSLLES